MKGHTNATAKGTVPQIIPLSGGGTGADNLADAREVLSIPTGTNLLINPWFQVNQREFSSATGYNFFPADHWAGNGSSAGGFEWRSSDHSILAKPANGSRQGIVQKFETPLPAGVYTLSARGSGYCNLAFRNASGSVITSKNGNLSDGIVSITYETSGDEIASVMLRSQDTYNVRFYAAKLERGSVSTLELDNEPDITLERLKCQRYFWRMNGGSGLTLESTTAYSATRIYSSVRYPVPMRTHPTVTLSSTTLGDVITITKTAATATDAKPCTALTTQSWVDDSAIVLYVTTSGLTQGDAYRVLLRPSQYIDFNAEL